MSLETHLVHLLLTLTLLLILFLYLSVLSKADVPSLHHLYISVVLRPMAQPFIRTLRNTVSAGYCTKHVTGVDRAFFHTKKTYRSFPGLHVLQIFYQ